MSRRVRYKEAAQHLGVKEGTIRAWVSRGIVPHYRISPRLVLFDLDELDKFLIERRANLQDIAERAMRRAAKRTEEAA